VSVAAIHEQVGTAYPHLNARAVLTYIRARHDALLGLSAVAIGHVAMVSVMVMTPVHMAHVDVSLRIIGLVISVHVAGMYALSPFVGHAADRWGRRTVIRIGVVVLLVSTIIAGTAAPSNAVQLGIGLFLLGVGWSCTLIAGSTLLSESIDQSIKASAQGTNDLVMNLSAAAGGALAGVIIATLSYGWLCLITAVPVGALGIMSLRRAAAE
jgi:MFS family permease